MTTEVTEAPASVEEAAAEKAVTPVDQLSVLSQALVAKAGELAEQIKKVAAKQATVGDVGKLLSEAIASSEDKNVKEMRIKRERAAEAVLKFDKEMEALVKPTLSIPTDEELAGFDTEYKALASQLNTFNTVFITEAAKDHPDISLFDYVGELPKGRKGAKTGQGTGTSRPRVSSVELTQDQNGEQGYAKVEKDGKSTFSLLAIKIKELTGETVSAGDFHEEWTKQNNVKDWTDLNEVSKFAFSVTAKDSKVHTFWIRVTK